MKPSKIVYGEACIHCAHAIDDDGTLYCREDCNQDVAQPKVQHAEAQKVVGRGAAQG